MAEQLLTVDMAGRALGVSRSTVWRLIHRGSLASVRRGGRRLIRADGLRKAAHRRTRTQVPPFSDAHPIFRLVGAGRSGGRSPGARDKHAILDR
jgi:excisionase family DNA binding protein